MNKMNIDFVQSGINYQFKNEKLLLQAFTRKSYSEENPEFQNNEILEFYGDEILDFFVTKQMYKQFSKIINGMLVSEKNEDELTKLKSILVSKQSLANCMYNFEFSKFLLLGKSDEKNAVQNSISVNEDLFEAIIGAVAVDCNWDYSILEKVCKTMLQMETVNTYLAVLVAEKSVRLGFGHPIYHPINFQITKSEDMQSHNFMSSYLGIQMGSTSKNPKTGIHEYGIEIDGHKFLGYGDGMIQAKLDSEKKAYHFLCKKEIKKHFADIDYENAVSTLHELFQKSVIMEVRYEFNEYHDENGNPIWNCKTILQGYENFSADNVSKKQAKQNAAKKLLNHIVNVGVEEKQNDWEIPIHYRGLCALWSDEEKERHEAEVKKMLHSWR